MTSWAEEEVKAANLGDKRLNRRLGIRYWNTWVSIHKSAYPPHVVVGRKR